MIANIRTAAARAMLAAHATTATPVARAALANRTAPATHVAPTNCAAPATRLTTATPNRTPAFLMRALRAHPSDSRAVERAPSPKKAGRLGVPRTAPPQSPAETPAHTVDTHPGLRALSETPRARPRLR